MGTILPLLMKETGLSERDIWRIVASAPVRYKTYYIPKRNGGRREISQPARELKLLQRIIANSVLAGQPIHSSATAYRIGYSIRANAERHVANGPILKIDFKDFFPSITDRDWKLYCKKYITDFDDEDFLITKNIMFKKTKSSTILRLAIGAPSSPILSNIIMRDFDAKIADYVGNERVSYTRYADDLTFSAERTGFLTGVIPFLARAIREIDFPSLKINDEKTVLATTKYKRMVTGLILTNDHKLSIGYRRKRQVRAALHHYTLGQLNHVAQARLAGMLAFINDVEPEFVSRLKLKYGEQIVERLRLVRLDSRPEA